MPKKENLSQKKVPPKESLTRQELQVLINLASNAQVRVVEANTIINLINKMSRMVDQLR